MNQNDLSLIRIFKLVLFNNYLFHYIHNYINTKVEYDKDNKCKRKG